MLSQIVAHGTLLFRLAILAGYGPKPSTYVLHSLVTET
jgi:hypothetical protein